MFGGVTGLSKFVDYSALMSLSPEQTLIQRILEGDSEAFSQLVRDHHVAVIGLCRSIVGTQEAAEDAAQEVFLKAYRSLKSFRGDAQFSTWIYRIAYRHCLDVLKYEKRRFAEPLDATNPENESSLADRIPDPVSFTQNLEIRDLAEAVMARLSPEYRLVLTLREGQGLSYEEIVEMTGWTLDSVKARLRRARETMLEIARHFEAPPIVQEGGKKP